MVLIHYKDWETVLVLVRFESIKMELFDRQKIYSPTFHLQWDKRSNAQQPTGKANLFSILECNSYRPSHFLSTFLRFLKCQKELTIKLLISSAPSNCVSNLHHPENTSQIIELKANSELLLSQLPNKYYKQRITKRICDGWRQWINDKQDKWRSDNDEFWITNREGEGVIAAK